jgi:hypothetical protein
MNRKTIQSPSYPSLSLPDAVEAVRKIEQVYRSSPADRIDAAKLLGYSGSTGGSNMALAALAAFGLVEPAGKGMLRVTPLARWILHPANEGERVSGMKSAAFTPKLYQQIRDQFPDLIVPPEGGIKTFLNRLGFNPAAVPTATKAFLTTAKWVQELAESDSNVVSSAPKVKSSLPDVRFGGAGFGDLVQWESQGALQFEKPRRVRWVSDDGAWVAVEGSKTGIPMDQVLVEKPHVGFGPPPSVPPEHAAKPAVDSAATVEQNGQRKAVFPVSEGDVTFLFSENMSLDGLEELEAYLAIWLKKEKRKASEV